MKKLQEIIEIILKQQKQILAPSTYKVRVYYLKGLMEHAEMIKVFEPCQSLYDSYVSRANTPDLRFQLFHTIRLVDKVAGTKAFTPDGILYNEPKLPSSLEFEKVFQDKEFPIDDNNIDTGYLIRLAEKEMEPLNLTSSTRGQYMKAWREMYIFLYLLGDTTFIRNKIYSFIKDATDKYHNGEILIWKWKILRRASLILLEVAETGSFKWKLFIAKNKELLEFTLENLRQQYLSFLKEQHLKKNTIDLYDYSFRIVIEGLKINSVSDFFVLDSQHIQSMIINLSGKLNLNSKRVIFPIVRQIFTYLHTAGLTTKDYSGLVLTPSYQKTHLRPYISSSDEEKIYQILETASLRTKAMIRLALRLGLRDIDICNLKFNQIDWINDEIIVEQEKTSIPLRLPLLEDVGNAIIDYIFNERPKTDKDYPYIFVREQAPFKKLSSMYSVCSRLFDKAGVTIVNGNSKGVHVFRYTLTHKLLLKKIPHQVITDTLGHISKESDKPYISMEDQMLKECPLDFSLIGQKHWNEGDHNV